MIPVQKREQIAFEVIRTLVSRFNSFPADVSGNRNAPFHEAFLKAFALKLEDKVPDLPFFISLSSWLHGLNTTLGQSFFENVAHILSDGEKRDFSKDNGNLADITNAQKKAISDIVTDLKNGNLSPNLARENAILQSAAREGQLVEANKFTADVFIEDDNEIVAIELKTVKPNAGEMRGEKQKILEAKASLFRKYPGKRIAFFLGFPFDPTSETPTGYDKRRFLRSIIDGEKYWAMEEVLLAGELWDWLSGDEQAMEQILDIINRIATPEFIDHYNFLSNIANRGKEGYVELLQKWGLVSELFLVERHEQLQNRLTTTRDRRVYNQSMFKRHRYNYERYFHLKELLAY